MKGTPRRPWTPEQDKELRTLVLSSNSVDTIARALNRTSFAIRRRANTLRLPLRKIASSRTNLIRRLVELGLKLKK
jgi:Fe2+ transport system protein FeoA